MKPITDITPYRYKTLQGFYSACNATKPLIEDHGDLGSINITSELTYLIQQAGRFAEYDASQLLQALDAPRSLCNKAFPFPADAPDFDEIYAFGIHQNGVDTNDDVAAKFWHQADEGTNVSARACYNKLYALRIRISYADETGYKWSRPNIYCALYDITDTIPQGCDWDPMETEENNYEE